MKIALLSLPMTWNYGGILQQYALQRVLEKKGHEVFILTHRKDRGHVFLNKMVTFKWLCIEWLSWLGFSGHKLLDVQTFKNKVIHNLSHPMYTKTEIENYIQSKSIEMVIVGSDQVWSRGNPPNLENFYLGFGNTTLRKASYSASFAKDTIDYSDEDIRLCTKLLKDFIGISVRETSGVNIIEKYFDNHAEQHLDPTLLLSAREYRELLKNGKKENYLFTYILDENIHKDSFIMKKATSLKINEIVNFTTHKGDRSVESWISGIANSRFVVTDSFHGMVFCIIFQKDFIVLGNVKRGMERFVSLLEQLNLKERLHMNKSDYDMDFDLEPINWIDINNKLEVLKEKSDDYLNSILE